MGCSICAAVAVGQGQPSQGVAQLKVPEWRASGDGGVGTMSLEGLAGGDSKKAEGKEGQEGAAGKECLVGHVRQAYTQSDWGVAAGAYYGVADVQWEKR